MGENFLFGVCSKIALLQNTGRLGNLKKIKYNQQTCICKSAGAALSASIITTAVLAYS